jgi:hypothetical protein
MEFCIVATSNDEQLLMRPFSEGKKNVNVEGGWKLKFVFCFMETTHEPLHLDKRSLAQ